MGLERLTRWCYRRRWVVLASWVVAFVAFGALGQAAKGDYSRTFSLPGSESQRAFDMLKQRFPLRSGDSFDIVFKARDGVTDAATQHDMEAFFDLLQKKFAHVVSVDGPYGPAGAGRISRDGKIAIATAQLDVRVDGVSKAEASDLIDAAERVNRPGLQVELGGFVIQLGEQPPQGASELIGILAAVVILLVAFGSLLAMGLPILVAVVGIGIGLAIVELLAHVVAVPEFAPQVAAMIGLGVGIDYALFIVTRYRTALAHGKDPLDADIEAVVTSGRAVLFAGTTVVISLLGLFLMRFSFLNGLALGASAAVLMTMLASITLLPAMLGFAGRRIDALRVPFLHHTSTDHRATLAYRWSREVQRHPWVTSLCSLGALLVLAVPMLSLHFGTADAGNDLRTQTTRRAYDLTKEGFGPGYAGPLLLAVRLPGDGSKTALDRLGQAVQSTPGVALVTPPQLNPAGDAAVVTVFPKTSPQDDATDDLVHRLRDGVIPKAVHGTGATVALGGVTAVTIDFSARIAARLPWFIGGVIVLSFLLLLVVFRSVLVPLKAAVMNLLSVGAAYGVIVAVFQWGWFKDFLGIEKGPIEAWVPMMLFAILFGLSMDYEVFLISRIKEEYLKTGDNAESVADGLAATARVITAAAAIMIAVFLSFVFGELRVLKLMGVGLAVAVFIDATLVRMVLVPSTMELLGDANWWFPKWLDRIVPHVAVEALEAPETDELVGP
ncbi:MAG: MMPL family transporter [Acidimicrobiia bacterium]